MRFLRFPRGAGETSHEAVDQWKVELRVGYGRMRSGWCGEKVGIWNGNRNNFGAVQQSRCCDVGQVEMLNV